VNLVLQNKIETPPITYPKYPHAEPHTHTCSICGTVSTWSKAWLWFGSWRDADLDRPVIKTCSATCRAMFKAAECAEEKNDEHADAL